MKRLWQTANSSTPGGLRIFLATNQEPLRAHYIMEDLGPGAHVDGMLHSATLGARKPDAAFFEAAGAASGFSADDIILVDDTAANVEAARASEWTARQWTGDTTLSALLEGNC
ncbi:MAG: HAD-IA family hydrolase [Xanthobacter sp.]